LKLVSVSLGDADDAGGVMEISRQLKSVTACHVGCSNKIKRNIVVTGNSLVA
jgi:hypothetical protein